MNRTLLICLLILLAACEPEYDPFDVPGKDFKISIMSFNQVGQPWYIQTGVSKSTAPMAALDDLKDASVKIYEDGIFVEQLTFTGFAGAYVHTAIYRSMTNSPKVGHEYRITVETPGFPIASATYRQPDPVPADMTFKFRSKENRMGTIVENGVVKEIPVIRSFFEVTFTFTDPPGDNYYDFRLETADTEEDFKKGNTRLELLYPETDLYAVDLLALMTDDSEISGQQVTYKFLYYRSEEELEAHWYRVSLRSLTAEEYKFTTKLLKNEQASRDPYAQPVITFTNVENGLGVFCAATPYSKVFSYSAEE